MEQDTNARQRQLEREITCLKDYFWRLSSRVCVVESFLKNKYGQVLSAQALAASQAPVKVIPIVISNQDHVTTGETETEVIVKGASIEHVGTVISENLTTDTIPDPSNDYSHAFGSDFQPESSGEEETIQEEMEVSTEAEENINIAETAGEEEVVDGELVEEVVEASTQSDGKTSEGEMIRIYKPDWKTFVVVKSEPTPAAAVEPQVAESALECHICQKKFSHQDNVQRHMLIHRAAQFKCDECGRGFNHQGNLNTHKLRHERVNKRRAEIQQKMKSMPQKPQSDLENRKFPCSYCDKRFYTAQQRNIHIRIHTGEKPFECMICGMRFNQKASLQDHSLGHVGEKTNYCHLCPAGFVRSRNLLKHIRQVHKMAQIKTILNGERVVEFVPESEAAAIVESRKNNVEIKRPPKPRVRKPKQKTARSSTSSSAKRSAKTVSSSEEEDKRVKIIKTEKNDYGSDQIEEPEQEYIVS